MALERGAGSDQFALIFFGKYRIWMSTVDLVLLAAVLRSSPDFLAYGGPRPNVEFNLIWKISGPLAGSNILEAQVENLANKTTSLMQIPQTEYWSEEIIEAID